ncbi:septation protein A [Pseudoduganella namucuonensis]|uniref:Inner membrane-spanning protein YciB n=1 Tax=Pseudoduganella namucuonensis TaxID=1035707 RepID=A0A1I7HC61_9BURK|nr:septation protein A [Pseudoduganella namucuonensis]SFU58305.1 intracellular septation protein [Pseudoduganella namucuonensis]
MKKFLFDLLPLIVFFACYKIGGAHPEAAQHWVNANLSGLLSGGSATADQAPMVIATLAGILANAVQIGYLLARGRKVDFMLKLSLFIFVVFGGLTIYYHDEIFIKWKPTLIYWLSAIGLLSARYIFKNNFLRSTMGSQITLPDEVWERLNVMWVLFLLALGAINLFVAFVLFKSDTASWVSFKAFGSTALTFAFIIGQTFYLAKYIKDEEA